MMTFSVLPSAKVSDVVLERYNARLSMNHLIENGDVTVCIDNEAVHEIYTRILNATKVDYDDIGSDQLFSFFGWVPLLLQTGITD